LALEEAEMDKWASWLLHRRDGDDLEQRIMALEHLVPIRDRVLENARLHLATFCSMSGQVTG
jgi:hypothetical protein